MCERPCAELSLRGVVRERYGCWTDAEEMASLFAFIPSARTATYCNSRPVSSRSSFATR